MARLVIADITEAKSIPQELHKIIPDLPHVPVQPILLANDLKYIMVADFHLPRRDYALASIKEKVIDPAEAKVREQAAKYESIRSG